MAIQRLEIHGYRSFEHAVWEPGKLNLLVGPNASGKSNLLRLLQLISDTATGKLFQAINDAQGMASLLWNDEARQLGWRLDLGSSAPSKSSKGQGGSCTRYEFFLRPSLGSGYRIAVDSLGRVTYSDGVATPTSPFGYRRDSDKVTAGVHGKKSTLKIADLDANESLLPQIRKGGLPLLVSLTKRELETWDVHQDVQFLGNCPIRMPVITQCANSIVADGSNLTAVLHTLYTNDRRFREEIDEGMRAAFGEEYVEVVFQPSSAQRIQLAVQWKSSRQPHAGQMLSDGTLRFLFLLAVLANPHGGRLIAIDEPEVGLHPTMLPIVAEYAVAAAERTQVVISTHSPEFLDCFTEYEPRVAVFHWEDARTHLYTLPDGRLKKWLEMYRLGQLFTSGDLDALAQPEVERLPDMEERFRDLPSEDAMMPGEGPGREGPPRE